MEQQVATAEKAAKVIRQYKLEVLILLLICTVIYLILWLRQEIDSRLKDNIGWAEKVILAQQGRHSSDSVAVILSEREVQRLREEARNQ